MLDFGMGGSGLFFRPHFIPRRNQLHPKPKESLGNWEGWISSSFFLCRAINTWRPSALSLILSSLVNSSILTPKPVSAFSSQPTFCSQDSTAKTGKEPCPAEPASTCVYPQLHPEPSPTSLSWRSGHVGLGVPQTFSAANPSRTWICKRSCSV